jgi:hypothetical protein
MPLVPFSDMPDSARVWVFASPQSVPAAEAARLASSVQRFVSGWLAHGRPVHGAMDWRYDRFLIVAADEVASGVSGCSIDSLFRTLGAVSDEMGVTLLDASLVWYRDASGNIQAVSRPDFRRMAAEGRVTDSTVVFDNTVATVGDLRSGGWERPAEESWHGKAFLAGRS